MVGKKPLKNMYEARASVVDYNNPCLYESEDFKLPEQYGCDTGLPTHRYNKPIIHKKRLDKGLININGVINHKTEAEKYMQFPITLKKTNFYDQPIEKPPIEPIHTINPNIIHTHWFPTSDRFVKYGHQHSDSTHRIQHPNNKYSFRFGITEKGRKTVFKYPTKTSRNREIDYYKQADARRSAVFEVDKLKKKHHNSNFSFKM